MSEVLSVRTNPVLHHVNLRTNRLDAMIEWYRRVVGLEVVHKAEQGAWLSNDGANHRLALLSAPGLSDDPAKFKHAGLHHTAYEYNHFDELVDTFERLFDDGIEPAFCLDHGMTISMYYRDPDGNFVELQVDVFGDWASSKSHMQSSRAFEANPIGMFFDPERLCAAYRDGRTFDDLHRLAMSGEFEPNPLPNIGLP